MLCRKANHAFHTAYKTSTKENWDKYKEARRAFRRTLRKSKRESWQDFCRKIETVHESARLHKLLSRTHVNEPGMLCLPHGEWTKSLEKANEHLMDVHFPGCCIDRTIKISVLQKNISSTKHYWSERFSHSVVNFTCFRYKCYPCNSTCHGYITKG